MDEATLIQYMTDNFEGLDTVEANGDRFFFYDPGGSLPPDRRMSFITLVTGDTYDSASNLSRPGVFRLNLGVGKDTYRALCGPQPPFPTDGGIIQIGHDFTAFDTLLPHPVYAAMSWVCILNPRAATFETVRPPPRRSLQPRRRRARQTNPLPGNVAARHPCQTGSDNHAR